MTEIVLRFSAPLPRRFELTLDLTQLTGALLKCPSAVVLLDE
jgi:hypothetical protein